MMPNGNSYLFPQDVDGKYRNTDTPEFAGAAITRFGDGSAELRWRDGRISAFNTAGWLIEERDRYSNEIQIIRDASNLITEIREPSGRALSFTYTTVKRGHDTFQVIASITDPLGRVVRYGYNAYHNGRLSTVTDPPGGVTTYTYGDIQPSPGGPTEGLLTITDARGITYLKNEYVSNGRVSKQTMADGGTHTFQYTLSGQTVTQTKVTDPRGYATTYSFNSGGYVTQIDRPGPTTYTTTYEYQSNTNRLLPVVDPLSRRTEYTYDSLGQPRLHQDAGEQHDFVSVRDHL